MDFETAYKLATTIEEKQPSVVVVGLRRTRPEATDSWAIDVMNRQSAEIATVDEKDLLDVRINAIASAD